MKLRKRTVDKVIDECFLEGFLNGIVDQTPCLEYASTSGLYSYNPIRDIALASGYEEAQRLITEALERREAKARDERRLWLAAPYELKPPADVIARCYAEARLA